MDTIYYFESSADFRAWLVENGVSADELWVGFYKVKSGKTGISYKQAVDEALCAGWIDGIRKSVDDVSYTNRFTPRRRNSNWSQVNLKRFDELSKLGLIQPAGLKAYNAHNPEKTNQYSFEQKSHTLDEAYETEFKANTAAWEFFQSQAPYYQRTAIWWVISAKQDETRRRRLAQLINVSANGERLPQFISKPKT
jgi:uncharacterized protein YdeI (YjbR/CyaY-like superfamily)